MDSFKNNILLLDKGPLGLKSTCHQINIKFEPLELESKKHLSLSLALNDPLQKRYFKHSRKFVLTS